MSRRAQRVGDVLRTELSTIISRRVRDPRVAMTTISAVDLSPDLKHARIHVSVVGDEAAREASLDALRHAAGFLRGQLAKELKRLRNIPELRFELDRGAEYSQRISELLENPDEHDKST
jgi:ribosome-binding factor A